MLHNDTYKKMKTNGNILRYIILIALTVVSIFPIVFTVFSSFKSNREFLLGGFNILPDVWHPENYGVVLDKLNFAKYTFNSMYVSVFGTIVVLLSSSMMGYCLDRGEFKGKKIIMGAYLITMFVSVSTGFYPTFELLVKCRLNNTINSLVLLRCGGGAANAFLVMGHLKTIPRTIDEAATIDGCSFFRRYWNIQLPMMSSILATIAILTFAACWNDYMAPMALSLSNESIRTLTVAVVALQGELSDMSLTPYNYLLSGVCISIVPMLILFIFMNKRIISGVAAGAVKG